MFSGQVQQTLVTFFLLQIITKRDSTEINTLLIKKDIPKLTNSSHKKFSTIVKSGY